MDAGKIAVMYVDEVKGIEFDRVFVVENKMSRNEKYIAYTRALSDLIVVVDDNVPDYDDNSMGQEKKQKHSDIKERVYKGDSNPNGKLESLVEEGET